MKRFLIIFLVCLINIQSSAQVENDETMAKYKEKPGGDYRIAGFSILGIGIVSGIIGVATYPKINIRLSFENGIEEEIDRKKEKQAVGFIKAGAIMAAGSIPFFIISAHKDRLARIRIKNEASDLGRIGRGKGMITGLSYAIPLCR